MILRGDCMDRIEQLKSECNKLKHWVSCAITERQKTEWLARLNANREEIKRLAMLLEVDCV